MTDSNTKAPKAAAKKSAPKKAAENKLRITVRGYDSRVLDLSMKTIVSTLDRLGATYRGPIPLPTDIRKYTVIRGAFIDKDSRDQFERRTHKRIIDVVSPNPKIIESLTNIELPSGVAIQVKMV
jgi:small subunit ribosomal protein S10